MARVASQPRTAFTGKPTPVAVLRPALRHAGRIWTRATETSSSKISTTLKSLIDCSIQPVQGPAACTFGDAWQPTDSSVYLLVFFTHWADLGSLELAQRIVEKLPDLQAAGVEVLGAGLGSKAAGAKFAELSGFPASQLYADPASACHKVLGYSPGFLGESSVNGYVKILPMLAGIGSPGTMQEVIRGYVGDRNAKQIFSSDTLMGRAFGVLGDGYQRPFELATVRLNNMITSLSNCTPPSYSCEVQNSLVQCLPSEYEVGSLCQDANGVFVGSELAPQDTQQLVQQGGSILIKGQDEILFEHADSGILKTTDVEQVLEAVKTVTPVAAEDA